MINRIFRLLIITLIASGCMDTNKTETLPLKKYSAIDIPDELDLKNLKSIKFSNFFSHIDGFELNCKMEPIGHVSKARIFGGKLIVFDKIYAKKIFAFDLEKGEFLHTFGNVGKGPGEFISIADFAIDYTTNSLVICDNATRKLLFYNGSGEFIREKKLDMFVDKICFLKDHIWIKKMDSKNNDHQILVLDRKFNKVEEFFAFNDFPFVSYPMDIFREYNGCVKLNYPDCNTIYTLNGESIVPDLMIKSNLKSVKQFLGNKNKSKGISISSVGEKRKSSKEIHFLPKDYFECDKFSYFRFSHYDKRLMLLREKDSGKQTIVTCLLNDFLGVPIDFMCYDSQYGAIGVLNANAVVNIDPNILKTECISNRLSKKINSDVRLENPIIIMLR